jgi:MinD-like ATPase involved in chromosome partitioning or flagellar assembly
MAAVISIHSYRGGTGKSNITANIAYQLAATGKRVAVVDTDIQSPGIHVIFNVKQDSGHSCLNDFLWQKCEIEEAVTDVDVPMVEGMNRLFLIPSSTNTGDIARIINDGYNVELLSEGFDKLKEKLELDYLLIDTHPGLNEETLLSISVSDKLLVILRPDQQDFEGSSITLRVASRLHVEQIAVVVNKVPATLDSAALKQDVETAYGHPVAAMFAHSDELMVLGSKEVFSKRFPEHKFTQEIASLCNYIR